MYTEMKQKYEVQELLTKAISAREHLTKLGTVPNPADDEAIRTLMLVLNIPANEFTGLIDSIVDCDRCGDQVLAYLTHVGLEDAMLCEKCKVEEDPLIALHESLKHNWDEAANAEVMDHRTDVDGLTESFPILVRLDD